MEGKNRPTKPKSDAAKPTQSSSAANEPQRQPEKKKPKPAEAADASKASEGKKRPREASKTGADAQQPRAAPEGAGGPKRPREASNVADPQRQRAVSAGAAAAGPKPQRQASNVADPQRPRAVSAGTVGPKRQREASNVADPQQPRAQPGGAPGPKPPGEASGPKQRQVSRDTAQPPLPPKDFKAGQQASDEPKKKVQLPPPVAKAKSPEEDTLSMYDEVDDPVVVFGTNPMQEYRPPTLTGITELPIKDFFLMVLLWSPRFFSPWILAWHEFNVFIVADPEQLESEHVQEKLLKVDLAVFGGACLTSILVSIIADLASMRYYVYMIGLTLYTLCPIAGGYVDIVLRARMYEKSLYNHWFSSIVLMRIAMAIPFVFFPVQFTCIFTEKANMSRQAHYNWTAFFAFFEFVNAYVAFWVIPEKCPTSEWKQITVWVFILGLMCILIVLTVVFTILVKSMRYTLMMCCMRCGLKPEKYLSEEYSQKLFEDDIPSSTRLRKLQWFGLLLIPLVFSSFVFATLERFVPDEDWDKHYVLSATSMFYLGRMLGVVVMVVLLFWIRHGFKKILQIPIFRGDVLVLGLPHVFNILALVSLVGRFATLSAISPGEVIVGPIPDESKAVVFFINQMFRNKTVCVRSDYFRPVKVRAFHYATRELVEPHVNLIAFTVIPEPGANPPVVTGAVLNRPKKNDLYIYSINLFSYLNQALNDSDKYREYMNEPNVIKHSFTELHGHPGVKPRLLVIRNFERKNDKNRTMTPWYMFGYGKPIDDNTPIDDMIIERPATKQLQYAQFIDKFNKTGRWFAQVTYGTGGNWSDRSGSAPCTFDADEYSLYVLSFYVIGPTSMSMDMTEFMKLVRCKVYKIAEVAGPEMHRLPSKKVLQRDKAIQMGMTFAGIAAGGLFVGIVYLFWMDPPFPHWQTTSLAVFWTLMIGAAESPKVKLVDVGLKVSSTLLGVQVLLTCLHVFASMNFYTPKFNFRKRSD